MRAIEAKRFSGYGELQQIETSSERPPLNQDDEPVLVHVVNLVVLRRKDVRSSRIKR